MSKEIEYTILAHLYFDPIEDVDISEYLNKLQEIGDVEITDVKMVDRKIYQKYCEANK